MEERIIGATRLTVQTLIDALTDAIRLRGYGNLVQDHLNRRCKLCLFVGEKLTSVKDELTARLRLADVDQLRAMLPQLIERGNSAILGELDPQALVMEIMPFSHDDLMPHWIYGWFGAIVVMRFCSHCMRPFPFSEYPNNVKVCRFCNVTAKRVPLGDPAAVRLAG